MEKASLVLFLALIGLTFAAAGNRGKASPRDTDLGVADYQCPNGTYVAPHETQCDLYYICGEDSPTHMYQCRDGYLFSLNYYGCDFKDLVDCGTRLPPFTCPATNGDYPVKTDACDSRYYTCTNGNATLNTCPTGGIFNAATGTCSAPGAIICPTSTTVRVPTSPGPFSCPPGANGSYPSPYTCTQYYVCIDGTTFLMECPAGLYYNKNGDYCDFPANVPECTGKKI